MTLGQGPEGGEGESHVDALEKSIPGREKSFRGLGTKESWVCLRSSGERREQGAGRPARWGRGSRRVVPGPEARWKSLEGLGGGRRVRPVSFTRVRQSLCREQASGAQERKQGGL